MPDIFTTLSEQELDQLDEFLLNRIDENILTPEMDEGIFDVSTLDGFFTAIISGPEMVPPSHWLPVVWGDFEPEWESDNAFEQVFSLLIRHMNSIASHLMDQPDSFEPLFQQSEFDGKTQIIVDEWCTGYMMGVELSLAQWAVSEIQMAILLLPIKIFGTEDGWAKLDGMGKQEIENIRRAITPNVREIYAYWLARREASPGRSPIRREEPRVGRNDPCPCGSGKKYKKCCLH
jgi:uncharacterized protein